ncbi:MAG TPA: DUF4142 domain-containing protein [Pyrinomonadaceae bacterium]|nr:DUF4142 domain-containing protein [Pyrinomonadaceae bacterium]
MKEHGQNRQVIKVAMLIWVALTVFVGGLSFALRGQNGTSGQNQNDNRNTSQNTNANANANGGHTGHNMNSGGGRNMNAGGQMNSGGMGGQGMTGALASDDRKFLMTAAMSGMKEVELSRMATTRASSEEVRRFAQQMVDEHTRSNQELMQLAASKGITLPTAPDAKLQSMLTRMGAMSGAQFDRAYLREAGVKEHRNAAKLFERESTRGRDADLTAFASRLLPAIRSHLSMAESMERASRGGGGTGGGSGNTNANTGANTNRP